MEKKRFDHVAVKVRVSNDGSDISSALTPEEYEKIITIRMEMGISLSHTVSSLIKQGLKYRKVKLDDDIVETKQPNPNPYEKRKEDEYSAIYTGSGDPNISVTLPGVDKSYVDEPKPETPDTPGNQQ